MAFKGSDKSKFCGVGGGSDKRHTSSSEKSTWPSEVRNPVSYDDEDVPLSQRLSRMLSSGTWSTDRDVTLKKRHNTALMSLPVKRPLFDNRSSLNTSVKKSKVSPYVNQHKDKDDTPLSRRLAMPVGKSDYKSLSSLKKELALVEKSFHECKKKRHEEEERLQSIKRDIEERSKELGNIKKEMSFVEITNESHKKMQEKIEECVKDFAAKQAQLCLMDDLIGERKQELKTKETELRPVMDNGDKVCEGKEQELKALSQKIAQCSVELKAKEKECDTMKKLIDEQAERLELERIKLLRIMQLSKNDPRAQVKDFESMKKQFDAQVKELELKEKRYIERAVELESKEKLFEGRVKKLKSKKKQLKSQVKEFEPMLEKFHGQIKELEYEKQHFDSRVKELESNERQLERRARQLVLKEEQLKGLVKEFDSKEEQFKDQVKDLKSKQNQLDVQVKELESEKEQFKGQLKEFQTKEKLLEDRVKEFESKEEEFKARMQNLKGFVSQMEDFKSEEKQFEGRGKEPESKDKKFKAHVKELKPKEKQFDGRMKGFESMPCKFDGKLKRPELREKKYDALIEPELGNQLSPVIDERSLMLLSSEQTDELELFDDDILGYLQGSSDPSKVVLDIIQNPIIKKCKIGDDAAIIDDSHILLLEELRKISPDIRPHVKEEAMKLALDMKANISQNTENSVAVLGFLLLLSIYGLVPSFDEDEVLKLFGLVSQHNIVVELFGAMGFVKNLIKQRQYDEAVRFSRVYNFSDNNQLVDLFEEHVQNLKLISESICKETNSIEIKDKARDQEVASLKAVLQCIIDNNLEFKDLLNKIDNRILELQRGKECFYWKQRVLSS
ncbi:hypothetical protein MtrunA17_Chr2g0325811 [Medicago truncatula]|uniref:FRIGIDA-like protein n=1 Tax=Medicago truncatula TaxID=3880 RepID=A0A396JEZ9_MEDTR|nr:hypothetical protein MtrunA17_Chr2g0325811 [Medicago truncatula]